MPAFNANIDATNVLGLKWSSSINHLILAIVVPVPRALMYLVMLGTSSYRRQLRGRTSRELAGNWAANIREEDRGYGRGEGITIKITRLLRALRIRIGFTDVLLYVCLWVLSSSLQPTKP